MNRGTVDRRSWLSVAGMMAISSPLGWDASAGHAAEPPSTGLVRQLAPLVDGEHHPVVMAMAVDRVGQTLAVACDDNSIRLHSLPDLQAIAILNGHRDLVRAIDFRDDGKVLASAGNDGQLLLWDRASSWAQRQGSTDLPAIASMRFSPDGRQLAAVGFDPTLHLIGEGGRREPFRCRCSDLRALAFDVSGERLAIVGRSGELQLLDPRSGNDQGVIKLHRGRIRDVEFMPGGEWIVTVGEDGAVVLFDLLRRKSVMQVDLLPCKLFAVDVIDTQTVAVAGSDNRIRVIECPSGRVRAQYDGHRGSINALAFSQGWLYSGGYDTTLRRWRVDGDVGQRLAEKERPVTPPAQSASR